MSFLDTEIKSAEIANTTEKIEEKLASLLKKRHSSENEEEMEIIKVILDFSSNLGLVEVVIGPLHIVSQTSALF